MKISLKRIAGAALAAGLLVAAVPSARPALAADPLEIPVVLPLTGGGAFLGTSENQSLQIIEKMVNAHGGVKGRPIHFAVQDDQSNPQVAVQLTNGALAKKPNVILGSSVVAMCNAMAAIVKASGPLQFCFSPGIHPAANSYTFSSSISTDDLALVALRYFHGKHWNRVAMITSTDASGQDAERAFTEAAHRPENAGLSLVVQEHFNPTDVTVSAQITRMQAAHPDAIVAWSTGTPFGTLLHGITDAGIDIPVLGGNGNLTYPQLAQYKAFTPKQMYFPSPRFFAREQVGPGPIRNAQTLFFTSFAGIGVKPDVAHSFSWDPALIVIDALQHVGANATPEALRTYIEGLHGWVGINGVYDFRDGSQRGLTANAAIVIRWNAANATFAGVSKPGGAPLR
jgi:branched-chain amino acid transport system substrate-binding protein